MAIRNAVNTTVTAHGIQVANATADGFTCPTLSNGQLLIGSTGAQPVAATITGGSNINVSNAAGSITISSTAGATTWASITGNTTAATGNGYFVTSNAVQVALPASSALGDTFQVCLAGGTSWTITQAAGQQIFFGSSSTTLGATGSLVSTAQGDTIELVCRAANTTWQVVDVIGNITVN